jgi:hypothetical protein
MRSQYDHLADSKLRARLRQGDPAAPIQLAQRFNARYRRRQIAVPSSGTADRDYPPLLLAMLWALSEHRRALHALADALGETVPSPATYRKMSEALLGRLWDLGRDGAALEELWTRQGLLPVAAVDEATPENVLGFLWWFHRRDDACAELLRRYQGGYEDAGAVLLRVVPHWDYRNYPRVAGLLRRSADNAARDELDAHAARNLSHAALEDLSADPAARVVGADLPSARDPAAAAEEREQFTRQAALVPIAQRILYKIRLNSESHPQVLTAEERDHLIHANLSARGIEPAADGAGQLAYEDAVHAEGKRIDAWMTAHPEPSGEEVKECILGHSPGRADQVARAWRLRHQADTNDVLLGKLIAGAGEDAETLAIVVQEAMDELARRVARDNRLGRDAPPRGPVQTFAEMVQAADALRSLLAGRDLDGAAAERLTGWRANFTAFAGAFETLIKLAACWRLLGGSLRRVEPAADVCDRLARWLGAGQWLATFPAAAKEQAGAYCGELETLLSTMTGKEAAEGRLLVLWLRAACVGGAPPRALCDADRAWWLVERPGVCWPAGLADLAARLIAACHAGPAADVTGAAADMRAELAGAAAPCAAWRELQDCLARLARG